MNTSLTNGLTLGEIPLSIRRFFSFFECVVLFAQPGKKPTLLAIELLYILHRSIVIPL